MSTRTRTDRVSPAPHGQTDPSPSPASKGKGKGKGGVVYEFGGPIGAGLIMLTLPLCVYAFYYLCNRTFCATLNPNSDSWILNAKSPLAHIKSSGQLVSSLFSFKAAALYLSWFLLHNVLYLILPGRVVEGVELNDSRKTRLSYPLNGLAAMGVSVLVVVGCVMSGIISPTIAYDEFIPLVSTAIVFCFCLSVFLYVSSLLSDPSRGGQYLLAPHGSSGNHIYDFFIGRTLNPRVFGVDLKYMCELRPGLIGWVLLIWSFAAKQYQELGSISNSMWLVCIFQTIYVIDALVSEEAILTTMDITTDGFGFMLVFGDLLWVPFTYSLQARYLVEFPVKLETYAVVIIVLIKLVGYTVFRGANNQKNEFRSNPNSAASQKMRYITTENGRRLLISGWWGVSRHSNYMGDLLMGLAWCLPCGFSHPLPYFYAIYFTILLVHRDRRDDEKCRKKYGKDWEKYCSIVKYRIFPGIY